MAAFEAARLYLSANSDLGEELARVQSAVLSEPLSPHSSDPKHINETLQENLQ